MSTRDGLEPSHSPDPETHTQPLAGPTWGQPPSGPQADGPTWGLPSAGRQGDGPPWGAGPVDQADRTQPGWGHGGGQPTVPAWGGRPADPDPSDRRRPSRKLAATAAAIVLLAGGYGISEALDRNSSTPTGAGIPTAASGAPVASAPVRPGEEPVAAVAKALIPSVVQLEVRSGGSGGGLGSGFVYDKNGYIMTAAHVVDSTDQVTVLLPDGSRLPGEVLGRDDGNDVAVVKVDRNDLTPAPLAIGVPLEVGQLAVAIGSPFGLEETVTAGVVSAKSRIVSGREVIQTDAPINPGNSGGVLADRRGRVIGINSAIRPANDGSNGNIGIGFAVPIDVAAKSAEAIVQGKPIQTGYLGVSMSDPTTGRAGALVREVSPGSPADAAGLQVGDLIVEIDGAAVENYEDLARRIRAHAPGDRVALTIVRNGDETSVSATLSRRPAG
jgi:putative serine protease PepD